MSYKECKQLFKNAITSLNLNNSIFYACSLNNHEHSGMVWGHYLDQDTIKKLSELSKFKFKYHILDSMDSPKYFVANFQRAHAKIKKNISYKLYGHYIDYNSPVILLNSNNWWQLDSVSAEQLYYIKENKRYDLILETLYLQDFLNNKTGLYGRKGPSVVEHRWAEIFPDIFQNIDMINSLNLSFKDVKELNLTTPISNLIESDETLNIF